MLLFCLACTAPPPEPPPRPPTASQAPPASQKKEIWIDSVTAGNPVVVRGHARTFENAVSVLARGTDDKVIREVHVMSDGEMGHHNPFEAELWLIRASTFVTVEAFEYSAKDGSVQSLATEDVDLPKETISAKLVFPAGDCTRFTTVTRTMPKSVSVARLLIEALLAGPMPAEKRKGASAPFPPDSAVKSVALREGVLTVDFHERLQNVGGSCAATAIRESVTRTLKQLPNVTRVVIKAGGSEALALQP